MARMIHERETAFGTTIYTDENVRMVGMSGKGLFGEEAFLDRNGRYAGSRRKGIFGEDVYLDRDYRVVGYAREGLRGQKILVDKDGRYIGRSCKGLGNERLFICDGAGMNRSSAGKPSWFGGVFFLVCIVVSVLMVLNALHVL